MPPINLANPVNWQHPLNRRRIGWWKSLPGGPRGRQLRNLVSAYNAAFSGTPTWVGNNGVGGAWGAIRVSNPAHAVAPAMQRFESTQPFTLGGSAMTTNNAGTQWIISMRYDIQSVAIGQRSGSAWRVGGNGVGTNPNLVGTTVPSNNVWYRVVYTWDGTNSRIYVNGVLEASNATAPEAYSGWPSIYLGRFDASFDNWTGDIDDLFYSTIAWDSNLIALDYREWRTGYPDALNRVKRKMLYAPLAMSYSVIIDTGMYVLTGQDATLTFQNAQWDLVVDTGMYTLAGQDATLTYDPANAYSMTVDTGSYALTGQDVTLRYSNFPTTMETGYYTVTGYSVSITRAPSPDESTEWYVGRRKRGQTVSMVVMAIKDYPDAAPIIDFWKDGLTLVKSAKMPIADYNNRVFALQQYLDSDFVDGHYVACIRYDYGIYQSQHYRYFEVIGGDPQGHVIAVHSMRRTLGQAVIRHTEDGNVKIGYDPRVE